MTDSWDNWMFFGGKMPSLADGVPNVSYPIGFAPKQIKVKGSSRTYKIKVKVL